jgi:integrase/recombinase XerD
MQVNKSKGTVKVQNGEYTTKLNQASHLLNKQTTHFRCTATVRPTEESGVIYLEASYNGRRIKKSTDLRCKREDLDLITFEVNNHPLHTLLLKQYISVAQSCYTELKLTKRPIDLHLILAVATGQYIDGIPTIQSCIKRFYEYDQKRAVAGEMTKGALKKNKVWNLQLGAFCTKQYSSQGQLTDIKPADIKTFTIWLKTKHQNAQNSTQMKAGYFKRFMNYAVENQWININPFINYRKRFINNKREGLTIAEVQSILDLKLIDPFINRVRDCFMFQCMTGLSYKDATELRAKHIINRDSEEPYIEKNRTKTGNAQIVYILPECMALLEKYKDDEYCIVNGMLMPFPTNVHMNRNLKVIGHMAGIKKILTTHLGRHTLGSILANGGATPLVLKEVLGHSDINMSTKHYLTVHHNTVVKGMKEALENTTFGKSKEPQPQAITGA